MLDVLGAAVVGLALGAATGIPLGVLNAALVEAAARVGRRHALGIGVGGALADGAHAALAFGGLAPLLTRHAGLERSLALVSAAVVLGYAIVVVRRRAPAAAAPDRGAAAARAGGAFGRGVAIGVALTLPNPAPLLAWVAVAGALPAATTGAAIASAAGVLVGSAAWFAALAHLASRGALDGAAARWLPRAVAALLVAFAAWAAWRGLR